MTWFEASTGSQSVLRVSLVTASLLAGFGTSPAFAMQTEPASLPHIQSKILADDVMAESVFGDGVAIDGSTLVAGAPRADVAGLEDAGAAYVFVLEGSKWVQQAKLVAGDAAAFAHLGGSIGLNASADQTFASLADERFGAAVAVSGDTVAVGAFGDAQNGPSAGAVYIFVRSDGSWTQQAKLTPSDGMAFDLSGGAVALDGDTLVVGAVGDDEPGLDAGAAYVFVRSGTSWAQQAKLEAEDGAAFDLFGSAVGLSGDTVVVGAFRQDEGGDTERQTDAGASYIFTRSGDTWTLQAKLLAADGAADDYFGGAVSLDGDTAIIGASGDDNDRGIDAGAAYIFTRSGTAWSEQTKLVGSHALPGDRFGYAVALDGRNLVIGARDDDDRAEDSGSAYFFLNTGDGTAHNWIQFSKYVADDGRRHDEFGRAVAVSGDWAVVGAPQDDDNSGMDTGSAYVFKRDPALQLVGDLLLRTAQSAVYNPTPISDGGDAGVVSVDVTVQNDSDQILSNPSAQILHLRRGYRVLDETGLAVTGSFIPIDFGDAGPTLEPGESFTISIDIGVPIAQPFNFAVNAYAEVTDAPGQPELPPTEPSNDDTSIVVEIPGETFGIVPRLYLFVTVE